jgi:predicted secreted protein
MYEINLKIGESYVLKLEGSGSAGYKWSFRVEGLSDRVNIKNEIIGQQAHYPSNYNMIEQYTMTGQKLGSIIIHFELRRVWEDAGKASLKADSYKITVEE